MQKVIINHLKGTKANQTETFMLPVSEIVFGRESDCQVVYDPEKDDLVSRKHAKLVPQEDGQFVLTDLNSRNGTFVNNARISGPVQLQPGDTVRLGKEGPEFRFDLDPRPRIAPPETRLAEAPSNVPQTREVRDLTSAVRAGSADDNAGPAGDGQAPRTDRIGRNTVERLITGVRSDTRRKMINIGGGILAIVVAVSGFFIYQGVQDRQETQRLLDIDRRRVDDQLQAVRESAGKSPDEISQAYADSTVFIEAAWKLIDVASGRQLYQRVDCLRNKKGKCKTKVRPWYIYIGGSVEPFLVSDAGRNNIPVGNRGHSGSGFVVHDDGFILTNRHVAAHWETQTGRFQLPGFLMVCKNDGCSDWDITELKQGDTRLVRSLYGWVPSKSKMLGGKPATGKRVEGRNDYLDVTFPKTKLRIPARLVRVSDSADVALIKIDLPQPVKAVPLGVSDKVIAGQHITVMGYPGISPDVVVRIKSQDPASPGAEWRTIPEPTITGGNVGRVIKGGARQLTDSISDYISTMGDVYQLTVNATGHGNSGGPVFNDKGHVVGIFTYGKSDRSGTAISFAVPIKHGMEIMGIQQVIE